MLQKQCSSCFKTSKALSITIFMSALHEVKSDFYDEVLRQLRENVQRKWLKLWKDKNWLFHHDNEPAQASMKTTQFLTKINMDTITHFPYSPDLAPCDYDLFPKVERSLFSHSQFLFLQLICHFDHILRYI